MSGDIASIVWNAEMCQQQTSKKYMIFCVNCNQQLKENKTLIYSQFFMEVEAERCRYIENSFTISQVWCLHFETISCTINLIS
jgi:hypothetical protein